MGLSWQQGPLSPKAAGRFLVPAPLPERLLFAEPLRRRMRALHGGAWVADSEDVVLLHEPNRYPVAYFPRGDVIPVGLEREETVTRHQDLGPVRWFTIRAGSRVTPRGAWQHSDLPAHANELEGRVAFAWRAMDAFYEEDERIVGHAADSYHRNDIRQTSRHLVVTAGRQVIADTTSPLVLYESGFAPRWYVRREDVDQSALTPVDGQTFCPYKGLANYYDIGDARRAGWSYRNAWAEVSRIADLVSFEPDKVCVQIDDNPLRPEPGQAVIAHGIDRDLGVDEGIPHHLVR